MFCIILALCLCDDPEPYKKVEGFLDKLKNNNGNLVIKVNSKEYIVAPDAKLSFEYKNEVISRKKFIEFCSHPDIKVRLQIKATGDTAKVVKITKVYRRIEMEI